MVQGNEHDGGVETERDFREGSYGVSRSVYTIILFILYFKDVWLRFNFWFLKFPRVDLEFWTNREKQFLEFYEQLDENIISLLTVTRSPCLGIYRQILETAEKGEHGQTDCFWHNNIITYIYRLLYFWLEKSETKLINSFLATLTKHMLAIEGNGLVDSKVEIYVLWRKLARIWTNCPNFQNFDYIVVLIKAICNMIMAEVNGEKNKLTSFTSS